MYNKDKTILSKKDIDIESYIEGTDVFNSKALYLIPKLPVSGRYTIDLTEYRIDLISLDLYKTSSMAQIILIYNGLTVSQLSKGVVLKVPYLADIRNLFKRISTITSPREYLKDIEN
jgi:hypothetical protein